MPTYRSFLFAPGNHARKVMKVFDCGADHVILDLEDAVAKAEKVATRALVVEALKRPRRGVPPMEMGTGVRRQASRSGLSSSGWG